MLHEANSKARRPFCGIVDGRGINDLAFGRKAEGGRRNDVIPRYCFCFGLFVIIVACMVVAE